MEMEPRLKSHPKSHRRGIVLAIPGLVVWCVIYLCEIVKMDLNVFPVTNLGKFPGNTFCDGLHFLSNKSQIRQSRNNQQFALVVPAHFLTAGAQCQPI